MGSTRVVLARSAASAYEALYRRDRRLFDRIRAALETIAAEPLSGKPLKGPLAGDRSYRVGTYRIIYRLDGRELVVLILDIGHRGDVYR